MAQVGVDPAKGAGERLTVESIPLVDLRFLTQSELTSLSRCSLHAVDLTRCDDLVIPKIDRSVFNESAGSRKQTYSRFRLARRKPDFTAKPLPLAPAPDDDPERLHNSKIIALFKKLFNADAQVSPLALDFSDGFAGEGVETPGRKRGRKPKTENPVSDGEREGKELVVYDAGVGTEKDKSILNKNGAVVDLVELAKLDDPFAPEISRRTAGMVKDEELLGFLTRLDGQWGSRRKRRKIVDANEFGQVLPDGWKVLMGMKKKQGQCWLFCRRYISPSGRYFMSCKEVSSYLMSLSGLTDVKQPPLGPSSEALQQEIQPLSVNVNTADTANSHYQKAASASPVTFEPDEHGEQTSLVKDGGSGILQEVGSLKCHKCSASFNGKNHLLHHLVSCHKRKRRKAGMPMDDDELTKEGHYECQFCNKRFTERVCFFGHVGIHVKNYIKGIEGSPGVKTMRNDDISVSPGGIPPGLLKNSGSVEANDVSVSFHPDIAPGNDPNVDSSSVRLPTESDSKGGLSNDHETCLPSLGDQITINSEAEKTVGEESNEKGDTVSELMDKEVGGAEACTSAADLELNSCSEYGNVNPSDSKNDTCQTSIEDKAADDINCSELPVQNIDGFVYEAEKSAELLDDVHRFCNEVEDGQEQMIVESELFGNDESSSVNANAKAMLAEDDVDVGEPYSTELKDSFIDLFGSGNSDFDEKMDVLSEGHQEQVPPDSSVVPCENVDTTVPAFLSERLSEQSSSPQDDIQRCVHEVDTKFVSRNTSIGMEVHEVDTKFVSRNTSIGMEEPTSDYMKNEIPFGANSFNSSRRDDQNIFLLRGNVSNIAPGNANAISAFRVLESGNIPFQSPNVADREENSYATESSSPCRISSRTEPNPANFFNPKGSFDANPVENKVVNFPSSHVYSPIGSREASNVFGICNSVKQTRDSESVLSNISVGGHAGLNGQIHDNMNSNTSARCATHLPNLGGSIGDISSGGLPSFPPQTISTSPSPFSLWNDQSFADSSRVEARGRVPESNSLSLASFQQTCNVGYNLNETYISSVDNYSRLNPLETHRDTDLMIGFRNLNARANQDAVNEVLWRNDEGNAMPNGLGGPSSSQGQLPNAFQPFDFLSDKGENDIFSVNSKFGNMENFGGLRSNGVEPMEFSFMTHQDSNPQLGGPKVLSYGNAGMDQGYESAVWLGKDTNMSSRASYSTSCVWCGRQFQLETADSDAQAGSIGYLCPDCKLP